MISALRRLLAEPAVRGLDLDASGRPGAHRKLIEGKPFLRRVYAEWGEWLSASIPGGSGAVIELGAGAGGLLGDRTRGCFSSDLVHSDSLDLVLDGQRLPFAAGSLRGIAMTNVFHHLPEPRRFLAEAARCVRPGGAVVMIEPWCTPWSRFLYGRFHHEEIDAHAREWEAPGTGPMTGANSALPWIVFARDRALFESGFPEWRLDRVEPYMPFRYLLSGGLSLRPLMPGWSFRFWSGVERALGFAAGATAMFARIRLVRVEAGSG